MTIEGLLGSFAGALAVIIVAHVLWYCVIAPLLDWWGER